MRDQSQPTEQVSRARNGDAEAFAELFEPLRPHLLNTIRGRLSPAIRRNVDPEDILQDTFVRGLHSFSRFEWRGDESFRAWLNAIATHVTLDVVRRQGRRMTLRIDSELKGDGAPPSRGMRRQERRERLQNSLRALSPDYQKVLELSRMQELSIKEIADRMGRTESAVKNLLLRATRKLRESFGETASLGLDHRSSQGMEVDDGQ